MDLSKSLEYLDPLNQVKGTIHIIGIGAMGSRLAEQLIRLGIEKIHVWDFDKVESKNITNQLYLHEQIGMLKTDALEQLLKAINPNIKVIKHGAYKDQSLSGYVFLAVDSIELRYKITELNYNNDCIKAMFDCRMGLEDAQSYGADWSNDKQKAMFINTMKFTDEEAKTSVPISACGTTLSVAPTVISTASFTVSNFINFVRKGKIKTIILVNAFSHIITTF